MSQDNRGERYLDATAANLIAIHDKVVQIIQGEIPLPEVVELFLTNYCSFACPFCRCANYHGDRSQHLDFGTLMKLLNELSDKGVQVLELGGGGEPLEHPKIESIFKLIIELNFRVGIITNGYVLTEKHELIDLIIQCSDWIRFSIDGITDDVYQSVHGRKDLSYMTLRKAITLIAQKILESATDNKRPKIGIKLIVQQQNEHQMLDAVDEAIELGSHYLQFKWLEDHPWSIPHQRRPLLIEQLNRKIANGTEKPLIVDLLQGYGGKKIQGRCTMSVLHPLVDWDGSVYICAFFHHRKLSHSIGNIMNTSFFDFWGSQHHREQIRGVDPKKCVPNCPLLRYNPVIKFICEEGFRFRYI